MRSSPSLVLTCFALSGCASFAPADGLLHVVGSVPADASCSVSVHAAGHGDAPVPHPVAGNFRERFIIGPSRNGHWVTLQCNGVVLADRKFRYGKDVRFGGDLSIDAP